MTPVLVRLATGWIVCALIQLVLWAIARRTRNAGIVDVGWALSFTPVVAVFGATATAPLASYAPIAIVVVVWSVRLGGYLISRGAATGPEEGRYVELRTRWGARAIAKFFVFFQAQAALTAVLASAFVVPFIVAPWDHGGVRALGLLVSIVGIAGESVADAQLARWKREPAHAGKVCDAGLWGLSRHPNYFFEWCVWLGYALYGLAFAPWGLIALAPQALLLGSILFITGIPPTETQSLRSRGDAYRDYQKRVSRFVPMPPKSRASDV